MADIVERLANWQPPLGWSMPTIAVDQHSKLMVETIKAITTLRATISRLEGEKAKLREALEPFAKCKPPPHHDGKRQVMIEAYDGDGEAWEYGIVDAGDFTRARLALAETGEKP